MVLIATYDLHEPGRDYPKVENVLKGADYWCHAQGSVWFLDTLLSPATWRDRLMNAGDSNDTYFVGRLTQNWAGFNMSTAAAWLKNPNRRW